MKIQSVLLTIETGKKYRKKCARLKNLEFLPDIHEKQKEI
jgi:hypothetical protein